MKHFSPLIAIMGLNIACAPPNKLASIEKTQDPIPKEQTIKIRITEKQANHFNSEQTLSCLISNTNVLRKKSFFLN